MPRSVRSPRIRLQSAAAVSRASHPPAPPRAAEPGVVAERTRVAERRYRDLFVHANDAIVIFDPASGRVLEANRCAWRLYGYSKRAFHALDLARLTPDAAQWKRYVNRVLRCGVVANFELQRIRRNGSPLWLSGNATVVDYEGRRAILSITRDITAQRRAQQIVRDSEQRLRAALEASLDACYVHECVRDRHGRIIDFRFTDVNRPGARLLRRRRSELVGRRLCRLFPRARRDGYFDRFRQVVLTGRPLVQEFPLNSRVVRAKWLQQQVVALGDGVVITARDITRQKETERAMQELSRRIIEAQEFERQRWARELHDSVGQVLASVRLRLQLLERMTPTWLPHLRSAVIDARAALEEGERETRRIAHSLRPRVLDDLGLIPALRTAAAEFRLRTRASVRLRLAGAARRLPAEVEQAIYRIAQEALMNIERHARARRVEIALAQHPDGARLRVRDNGRGFGGPRPRRGLGLTNMEERAVACGGSLDVRSVPTRGTVIDLRIPIRLAGGHAR